MTPMIPRPAVAALLVLVLPALGALAHASPPDPGWIGGLYDAADGDDAILAVTGLDQAPPLATRHDVAPHEIHLGSIVLGARPAPHAFAPAVPAVRAPPSF
jgi:hypothetical protein